MRKFLSCIALAMVLVFNQTAASAVYANTQVSGVRDTSWKAEQGRCPAVYTDHDRINEAAIDQTTQPEQTLRLRASWYGNQSHGRTMRYGDVFHECDATVVAFNDLPAGTVLRVRNRANNRQVLVVVQDTGGPLVSKRLDLSRGAAQQLDQEYVRKGVLNVEVEVLDTP